MLEVLVQVVMELTAANEAAVHPAENGSDRITSHWRIVHVTRKSDNIILPSRYGCMVVN